MIVDLLPYLGLFVLGTFTGLVLGAFMARADLRAAQTETAALRASDPSGSAPRAASPPSSEGR